jgi:two-component system sensor histidine kinase RpfC
MVTQLGEEKGLKVSCNINSETPFSIIGSPNRIRQILINLMGNAIKFTDKGYVNLNVYPVDFNLSKVRIRFEVIDTGIGIEPSIQNKIFEYFTQADSSSSRSYSGSGLGTTISKNLAELMGGEIGVKSNINEGSTFWVEIPFDITLSTDTQINKGLRLLILSSKEFVSNVEPFLNEWNVQYKSTDTPARAFNILLNAIESGNMFHAVIVDQAIMDIQNPIQFAKMVRSDEMISDVSLILINSSESMLEVTQKNRYYLSTIDKLTDMNVLFNALHAAQSDHFNIESEKEVKTLGKSLHILIAEDNPVNRQVLQQTLLKNGHQVELANDGEEALDLITSMFETLDLIILDMNMPGKSGLEVLQALNFMDTSSSIPTIILSADATPKTREICLSNGAVSYLTKPIQRQNLLKVISDLDIQDSDKKEINEPKNGDQIDENIFLLVPREIINHDVLRDLIEIGGGLSFLREIANKYESDGIKLIKDLNISQEDDYPAFRSTIHTLKGSSYEIGATEVVNKCLECEALKSHDIGTIDIRNLTNELKDSFYKSIKNLNGFTSQFQNN